MMVPCHQEVHSQVGPEVVQDRQHMEIRMVNSILVDDKIFGYKKYNKYDTIKFNS